MNEATDHTQAMANHAVANTIQVYRALGFSDEMIAQTLIAGGVTLIREFADHSSWAAYFRDCSDLLSVPTTKET